MKKLLHCIVILAVAAMATATLSCRNSNKGSKTYDGIDVSRHQKDIDWEKVGCDDNIKFVYIKATEGATHVDSLYHFNIEQASRNGIKVGSYHFFSTKSPVKDQFQNFTRELNKHHQDLIPMIDVEVRDDWSRAQLIDSVKLLAIMIENWCDHKPVIYSTVRFYNELLAPQFNDYPLYIGRYANEKPQIKWEGKYTLWQYTEDGIITGINERVDMSRFHENASLSDIEL